MSNENRSSGHGGGSPDLPSCSSGVAGVPSSIGLAAGVRIGERWREPAEKTAAVALLVLGEYLITAQALRQ
jgi:hypothetical protein